jgi:two-component system chemotaxis response regulator CheB
MNLRPAAEVKSTERSTHPPLRGLVVEDSLTIRKYLVGVLTQYGCQVVGEAEDGDRAIALCKLLQPDVITMDMILPGLSGLAATEQIMAFCPTPILIVSASANRGELFQTYEALAAGAVDVFDKVRAEEASAEWERRFIAAVRMVARIKVITHPRARLNAAQGSPEADGARPATAAPAHGCDLIAIGASTGGPAAIADILHRLPATFPIPMLIVLHLSELFSFAFAEWLNTLSPIPAHYAVDGEPLPRAGTPQIVLAPAGRHLVVDGSTLRLVNGPERNSCRPSIDVLFESLARQAGIRTLLCLLTGMGRDGAQGMAAGRRAGLETVAQDEASSVIFGMPAEAIRLGGASRILPVQEIAPYFTALAQASHPSASASRWRFNPGRSDA